jgi:hypothetical protein
MQPLTAPERPISHYRNGKLRRVGPEPEPGAAIRPRRAGPSGCSGCG